MEEKSIRAQSKCLYTDQSNLSLELFVRYRHRYRTGVNKGTAFPPHNLPFALNQYDQSTITRVSHVRVSILISLSTLRTLCDPDLLITFN